MDVPQDVDTDLESLNKTIATEECEILLLFEQSIQE